MNLNSIQEGQLQPGVRLFRSFENDDEEDRFLLSAGTRLAAPFNRPDAKYFDVAYLPSEPWRRPTAAEMGLLAAEAPGSNYSTSIALVQVPQDVLEPFRHIGMDKIDNREDYYALMKQPAGDSAVEGFAAFARRYMVREDDFQIIRIFNKPGLLTATYVHNPQQDFFLGLHVDFLDKQTIYGRSASANRISLNLGEEDRHFLYMNLTMDQIIEIMRPSPDITPERLVFDFLEAYPRYPVVKVCIRPGEAYIAPTQNVIHDGIGSANKPDFNLTIIGHFALTPRPVQPAF